MKKFWGWLLPCALLFSLTISAQAVQYEIKDLGFGQALGINNSGHIVGKTNSYPAIWKDSLTAQKIGDKEGYATDINDNGQVAGVYFLNGGYKAFFWQDGSPITDLGTLGGENSECSGINNNGQVIGRSQLSDNTTYHNFLWQAGSPMQDLNLLSGINASSTDINDNGQIVFSDSYYGYIWKSGATAKSLGLANPRAINNKGHVVGQSSNSASITQALLWQNDLPPVNLGNLGNGTSTSCARDINNNEQVVGYSWGNNFDGHHGFLWQSGSPMLDLGTLGGVWCYAVAINDKGQIVGSSTDINDEWHAVLWNPLPTGDPDITIITPTCITSYTTYDVTINISGTATAAAGVASIKWSNDKGGSGTCTGTTSWSVTGIALQTGDNIITITATDTNGKSSTSTMKVTRLVSPPEIHVYDPLPHNSPWNPADTNYVTVLPTADFYGTVWDRYGVSSLTWTNNRGGNGTCALDEYQGTLYYRTNIGLQPGDNIITLTATNIFGVTATYSLTVTRIEPISIGSAKKLPDNTLVGVTDAVVTYSNFDYAYVESTDRSAGLKLIYFLSPFGDPYPLLGVGQKVSFSGYISKVDGEYQLDDVDINSSSWDTSNYIKPMFMTTKAIGNDPTETLNHKGIDTNGLLVSVLGKVTEVDPSERIIYVDDGAGLQDGMVSVRGIRVSVPYYTNLPEKDQMVVATGVSRIEKQTYTGTSLVNGISYPIGTTIYVPSIWMRDADDLKIY